MIRRIGEAENPYIVRVAEEDYAGPRSIFPTADRLIGDAVNPYVISPWDPHPNPLRQMGRSARTPRSGMLDDAPESANVTDTRDRFVDRHEEEFPRPKDVDAPAHLRIPDEPAMKAILQNQQSKDEYERFMQDDEERRRYGLRGYGLKRGLKVRPPRKDPLVGE